MEVSLFFTIFESRVPSGKTRSGTLSIDHEGKKKELLIRAGGGEEEGMDDFVHNMYDRRMYGWREPDRIENWSSVHVWTCPQTPSLRSLLASAGCRLTPHHRERWAGPSPTSCDR